MADGLTIAQMAERYRCTPRSIRNVAHRGRLALPRISPPRTPITRPPLHAQLYEPGWLAAELAARRSLAAIAAEVGCSTSAVRRAISKLGIVDRRQHGEILFPQLHDPAWLRRRYHDDGASSTTIAIELGCGPGSVLRPLHSFAIETRPGRRTQQFPGSPD